MAANLSLSLDSSRHTQARGKPWVFLAVVRCHTPVFLTTQQVNFCAHQRAVGGSLHLTGGSYRRVDRAEE